MTFTQHGGKAQLTVGGLTVKVNYVGTVDAALDPARPTIVLVHGHSSSLHEHDQLLPELIPHANVFSFDQPNCGKSSDVPASKLASKYGKGASKHFEALFFLRDVIDVFVRGVVLPKIATPTVTIAGGSLGGNLTLLVAERRPRYPWLGKAAAWSPGSSWGATLTNSVGAGPARERAKESWVGERDAFLSMTFVELAVPPVAAALVGKKSYPQPWYWFWDCWDAPTSHPRVNGTCPKCTSKPVLTRPDGSVFAQTDASYPPMSPKKAAVIQKAFLALYGEFTAPRAAWHWELAAEQVELSHRQLVQIGQERRPRCGFLTVPTLLLAGAEDRFWPAGLHDETFATYQTAQHHGADVAWRSVPDAGHSLHNEKPAELSGWIRAL